MRYLIINNRLKKYLSILLSVIIFSGCDVQVIAKAPSLYAKAAVLMDGATGRVLYGRDEDMVMPMASTTKIMTLIIALETTDLQEIVTASKYASSMPKVHLGMREGKQYYLKDLLYSLMLESHNDSAVAIAEHIGQKSCPEDPLAGFLILMNQKALEIGCKDTFFLTPNGLDATVTLKDENQTEKMHSTTAKELALIMRYCLTLSPKKEEFVKITQCRNYSFNEVKINTEGNPYYTGNNYSCVNHNALLSMMEGVVSGKTGYTGKAGYCYIGAVERNGNLYIVALLACGWPNHKTYKWADMKAMISYALDTFSYKDFQEPDVNVIPKEITVRNACADSLKKEVYIPLALKKNEALPYSGMLLSDDETVEIKIEYEKYFEAPVTYNQKVGTLIYELDGTAYCSYDIVTEGTANKINFYWCLKKIMNLFSI